MKEQKGITLVALVVSIIILVILAGISIHTVLGENGIIEKAKQAKQNILLAGEEEAKQLNQLYYELESGEGWTEGETEEKKDEIIELLQSQVEQLEEQIAELQEENEGLNQEITDLNTQIAQLEQEIADLKTQVEDDDIEIADLLNQVSDKQATIDSLQSQLDSLNATLAETTATADKILKGYTAYSGGQLITGTMTNNGAVTSSLNCGASYTIPAGYHNGSGKVTANSLASQTSATATAASILSGKTAWVNGTKLTGTNKGYDTGYSEGYTAGKNNAITSSCTFYRPTSRPGSSASETFTGTYTFSGITSGYVIFIAGGNSYTSYTLTASSGTLTAINIQSSGAYGYQAAANVYRYTNSAGSSCTLTAKVNGTWPSCDFLVIKDA